MLKYLGWISLFTTGCSENKLHPEDPDGVCPNVAALPGTVAVNQVNLPAETGMLAPEILWHNEEVGDVDVVPIVGHLNDDNGDGELGAGDVPEVVIVTMERQLVALRGDTGVEQWRIEVPPDIEEGPHLKISPAIGDLDGDGWPEVVWGEYCCNRLWLSAWHGDGSLFWEHTYPSSDVYAVAIADLDGDGTSEIIAGRRIFDGPTGEMIGKGNSGFMLPSIADVDGDGLQEVVVGDAIYQKNGSTLRQWEEEDGWTALGNFDTDEQAEIVVSKLGTIRLHQETGDLIWSHTFSNKSGPPVLVDVNLDGKPEIGVATSENYDVLDSNGSLLWSHPIQETSSGVTGACAFDFEADGRPEIIYADEEDLWVFDGATGEVRLQYSEHTSHTGLEYPIIADANADGHADILFGSNGSNKGVTVLTDANQEWRPARQIWNQYAYSITNVNDDGSIPKLPEQNWLRFNSFRSADLSAGAIATKADAIPLVVETCSRECNTGRFQVMVQIGNAGIESLPAGIYASLYGWSEGKRSFLASVANEAAILSGETSPGLIFNIPLSSGEYEHLEIVVDDFNGRASVYESNETNNQQVTSEKLCGI